MDYFCIRQSWGADRPNAVSDAKAEAPPNKNTTYMNDTEKCTRRDFLRQSALMAGGLALASTPAKAARDITKDWNSRKKSGFTLWQLPSHTNDIGNSYVFRTTKGKVIVMDGGRPVEANTLRGFIGALGNEVEAWFISHPHDDHMGALDSLLKNPQDLRIKHIYHSRMSEAFIRSEPTCEARCRDFYHTLDHTSVPVTDIQEPGQVFDFDDMHIKILSVASAVTEHLCYNNASMIMRVWDKKKTMVFLADAHVDCGNKALEGPYADDLNCEYLQMAHHGQQGCTKEFYNSIRFRACLWPTPLWVWNNDTGKGYNTGPLQTIQTREWMKEKGITEHHVTCTDGLWRLD